MAPAGSSLSASSPLTALGGQFQRTSPRSPPLLLCGRVCKYLRLLCKRCAEVPFVTHSISTPRTACLDLSRRRRNSHASLHAQRPMRAKHARLEPAREGLATRVSPELAEPTFPSKGEGTDAH